MNKRLATLSVVLLASVQLLAQQPSKSDPNTARTEHVEGRGCLRPGRQEGCLIVNDIKAHRKYSVFFVGKDQPELYTAISFEGIAYPHVSHCRQGQKLQVTDWKPLPEKCSQPNPPQSKSK